MHDNPYSTIVAPPELAGAVNVTVTEPSPPNTPVTDGAPGTVAGTNVSDAADGAPVPAEFVAATVHV